MHLNLVDFFKQIYRYEDDYYYNLMPQLYSKTNNFKIIEAFSYIQLYRENKDMYDNLYPKVAKIANETNYMLDDANLDLNSSNVSSIWTTEFTESEESDIISSEISENNSDNSEDFTSEETSIQYRRPDYTWKFKTKELGIHYIPDCLQGNSLSFTGDLEYFGRDEVIQWCQNLGATAKNHITKNLDYLVVGNNPGKTKLNLAKKWDIRKINEQDFIKMLIYATNPKNEEIPFNNELNSKVLEYKLKKDCVTGISTCIQVPEKLIDLKKEITSEINSGYQLI